jgi:hypothetical protein
MQAAFAKLRKPKSYMNFDLYPSHISSPYNLISLYLNIGSLGLLYILTITVNARRVTNASPTHRLVAYSVALRNVLLLEINIDSVFFVTFRCLIY